MAVSKGALTNSICRKAGITRLATKRENLSKRELLLLSSRIDIWLHLEEGGLPKEEAEERRASRDA